MSDPLRQLFIGTSGWSYDWKHFYPKGVSARKRLPYYSSRFAAAEVNYTFYRLPQASLFEKWKQETPENFQFALKLSRYISHVKRLKGIKQPLRDFLKRARVLQNQLGPVLVQLPPNMKWDTKTLGAFLETCNSLRDELSLPNLRLAFEARHTSWFETGEPWNPMLALLQNHNAAFVFAHSNRYPYPLDEPITAAFVYLRFHGPDEIFASPYGQNGLQAFAGKIARWLEQGLEVYAFFNNDVNGGAPDDAQTLRRLVQEQIF